MANVILYGAKWKIYLYDHQNVFFLLRTYVDNTKEHVVFIILFGIAFYYFFSKKENFEKLKKFSCDTNDMLNFIKLGPFIWFPVIFPDAQAGILEFVFCENNIYLVYLINLNWIFI